VVCGGGPVPWPKGRGKKRIQRIDGPVTVRLPAAPREGRHVRNVAGTYYVRRAPGRDPAARSWYTYVRTYSTGHQFSRQIDRSSLSGEEYVHVRTALSL
jgi:hypothetical protein